MKLPRGTLVDIREIPILDTTGVYVYRDDQPPRFLRVNAPDKNELEALVQRISKRVGRCLEEPAPRAQRVLWVRQGLLERDAESAWLDLEPAEDTDAMPQILGSSASYRIAVGPQQGRKAFMIRIIRPLERPDPRLERVAKANGFSLHAGVSCEGHQENKRERLCRYIARPAIAIPRLSQSSTGKMVYTLKTPYRDGTTQVAFDRGGHPPVDFIARLAALVPKPRVNLTRLCGAPHRRVYAESQAMRTWSSSDGQNLRCLKGLHASAHSGTAHSLDAPADVSAKRGASYDRPRFVHTRRYRRGL